MDRVTEMVLAIIPSKPYAVLSKPVSLPLGWGAPGGRGLFDGCVGGTRYRAGLLKAAALRPLRFERFCQFRGLPESIDAARECGFNIRHSEAI